MFSSIGTLKSRHNLNLWRAEVLPVCPISDLTCPVFRSVTWLVCSWSKGCCLQELVNSRSDVLAGMKQQWEVLIFYLHLLYVSVYMVSEFVVNHFSNSVLFPLKRGLPSCNFEFLLVFSGTDIENPSYYVQSVIGTEKTRQSGTLKKLWALFQVQILKKLPNGCIFVSNFHLR